MGVIDLQKKRAGLFFIVCAAALVGAVALRAVLIRYDIDPATGFYTGGGGLAVALNLLLVAATLFLLAPMFLRRFRGGEPRLPAARPHGVLAGLVAAALLGETVYQFRLLVTARTAGNLFISMAAVLAAVFFAVLAADSFAGRSRPLPVLALFPAIWAAVHLAVSFMHYTTIASVSEYMYDMMKMMFDMIFLYYYARCAGRVPNEKEAAGMLAFGLPAVLFTGVSTLPRYMAWLMGQHAVSLPVPEDLLYLLLAGYILYALTRLRSASGAAPAES